MGVDLTLLPVEHISGESGYSHSVLSMDRDYDLFEHIQSIKADYDVPRNFQSYISRSDDEQGGTHYGTTIEDAYGDPVRMVMVKSLVKAMGTDFKPDLSRRNKAILQYLQELEKDSFIALFWG